MSKIKEYVEALIFAFGDGITMEEIAKRTKFDPLIVKKAVNDLNKEYTERKSAFTISTEGNVYRMRLRGDLITLAEDTLKTDMKKGVMMTLSLIAMKGKIKQAELIKMRGSLSYQHVKELVSRGLVTTSIEDNHKIIKLSPSFYDYFDVNSKEFKEVTNEVKEDVKKESEQTVEYTPK
ncbi:MAG: SMC-Scp complex subunit ScpB [Candidatus Parvarchaeota archaeon]|nr:SMC-Scp complex subunit ScpB [Candidatus Parvarchaeota archaeon]MCL5101508.1 SMC-Scp complex subunit ScpB [Candidatus Parvarchaeota archaeon]